MKHVISLLMLGKLGKYGLIFNWIFRFVALIYFYFKSA